MDSEKGDDYKEPWCQCVMQHKTNIKLSLATYNIHGLFSNKSALIDIIKHHSIVFLQEHWLHLFDINEVSNELSKHNVGSSFKTQHQDNPIPHTCRKRGQGGVVRICSVFYGLGI